MKKNTAKTLALVIGGFAFTGCATNHDQHGDFILGAATDKNIATQSIRSVDIPNSKGLTGQSGERAVAAITRLNTGEQTELSDVSSSGIGNSNDD